MTSPSYPLESFAGPDDNVWFDAISADGKAYISTATASGVVTNYQFSR